MVGMMPCIIIENSCMSEWHVCMDTGKVHLCTMFQFAGLFWLTSFSRPISIWHFRSIIRDLHTVALWIISCLSFSFSSKSRSAGTKCLSCIRTSHVTLFNSYFWFYCTKRYMYIKNLKEDYVHEVLWKTNTAFINLQNEQAALLSINQDNYNWRYFTVINEKNLRLIAVCDVQEKEFG